MTIGNCFDGVLVASYTYDNNGNTKSRTVYGVTTTYVWDDQNRLVQVETPNGTVSYAYDDDNIRVSETKGGVTTNYLLDKNLPYAQVLAEYENGSLEASYTYGLDLIEQERNGSESYYHVDGLGSTRGLTDENGEVTDTYIYDTFGNVVGSVGTTENDYLFAGEQWDETLGQYYLRQRYYDPTTGRFTRRDTWEGRFGEPITLHKYLYANSNPVSYIDPSGLNSMVGEQSLVIALIATFATLTYISSSYNSSQSGVGFGSQQAIDDFLDLFGALLTSTGGTPDGDKAIDKLKEGAVLKPPKPRKGKKKTAKSTEYEKEGDFDTANQEFDEIAEEFGVTGDIKDQGESRRSVKLPDGTSVGVRPKSSGSDPTPTIQVDRPGVSKHTKIRYVTR